ncbi:S-adenosyl-L-methionine-dependent methyltransferase [Acaromyces ingoldii]|uniref:S-adenosyl-L-methionine-dependent methyltransferase n=1 Tax=Acaromyces ingoldii TaxID=215250 RepID=A0A316YCW7_9BASI|nr:S-adenosyl-L-methionine-dependent methyltransferase [Acaromyces ingoldii]PWN87069.1 S-adenosyl-L-methionine-dependent methyltransferase [Acaromyces ingoldii]
MSNFYLEAASIIDDVEGRRGSLKSLAALRSAKSGIDAKRLLALAANTLSYKRALTVVLDKAGVLREEAKTLTAAARQSNASALSLTLVLVHDLLFTSRGRIAASMSWPPSAAVTRHAARLKAELVKLQIKEGKVAIKELRTGDKRADRIPRWVRVNERLVRPDELLEALQAQGWTRQEEGQHGLAPKRKSFMVSPHLGGCMLAFHPSQTSNLVEHHLYRDGKIVLQDLASCFPAEILLCEEAKTVADLHVVDATAAPGNKTSHLSALLAKRKGLSRITAFEKSAKRFATLCAQLDRAGALSGSSRCQHTARGAVTAVRSDFMEVNREELADVTHMLLDPSCSGSGIVGRLDHLSSKTALLDERETEEEEQSERLAHLATFQLAMIEFAMGFPSLRRFCYSTCSTHVQENEEVVLKALKTTVAQSRGWKLAGKSSVLPSWPTRGLGSECGSEQGLADAMIRCDPGGSMSDEATTNGHAQLEATNGFFVTCFVRESENKSREKNRKRKARAKVMKAIKRQKA